MKCMHFTRMQGLVGAFKTYDTPQGYSSQGH